MPDGASRANPHSPPATRPLGGRSTSRPKKRAQPLRVGYPHQTARSQIAELVRTHTEEAISTLVEIMTDKGAPPSARVSAASVLLDRGWGKAPQEVTITDGIDVRDYTDAQLDDH